MTLIQQGHDQGDSEPGQAGGESGGEDDNHQDDDDAGNCDDLASDCSSQDSSPIEEEELEIDSEPFLPQLFGLIEDPGVIRINNIDYGDVCEADYDEIISFKQSRSFIGHIYLLNKNSKSGLLRFSKSLNDVSQEYEDSWPHYLNLFR